MNGYHTGKIYRKPLPGVIDKAAIIADAPQIVARAMARGLARFDTEEDTKAKLSLACIVVRKGRHLNADERRVIAGMHRAGLSGCEIHIRTGVSMKAIQRVVQKVKGGVM